MPGKPERILIGGGVRSGKSALALSLAQSLGVKRAFVATAQAFDDEMRQRIAAHQAERGNDYPTHESPLELPETLAKLHGVDVVVVDCLTLWLSNMLLADFDDARVKARLADLQGALDAAPFDSVIVSNEVGMGIVPETALGRRFRDVSGRAHQALAATSTAVYVAMMGLRLRLRPGPVQVVEAGGAL